MTRLGSVITALLAVCVLDPLRPVGAQATVVRTLVEQASRFDSAGRRDDALRAYDQALAAFTPDTPDSLQRAVLMKLGRGAFVSRAPRQAMVWFRRAALVGEKDAAGARQRGVALLNLAAAAEAADQLDDADAAAREALALFDQQHDTAMLAAALNSAGMIRRKLGFPDQAARNLQNALTNVRAVHNTRRESVIENNRGLIADDEAQDARGPVGQAAAARAIAAYRASLALLQPTDTADRAQTLSNLGVAFRRQYLAGGARSFLDSADRAYADAGSIQSSLSDRLGMARLHHNQALIRRDRGDLTGALAGLNGALVELREAKDEWWVAVTLRELADTYRAMGTGSHTSALTHFDSAARAFEHLTEKTGGDASRAAYRDQKGALSLYDHWMLSVFDAPTSTTTSGAACDAFEIAERGRAQALRALMSATATRAGTPGEENAVRVTDGCRTAGHPALAYYVTADTLLVWLADGAGRMRVSRVPIGRDSLQSLIATLREVMGVDDGPALPPRDSIAVAAVIATRPQPTATASTTRRASRSGTITGGAGSAVEIEAALARLASVLLPAELRGSLPASGALLIIPHGSIALVPFAALPRTAGDTTPLGARLSLIYAPSAEVARLAERVMASRTRRGDRRAMLVAGDPTMPPALDDAGRSVHLDPLPGAHAEAVAVAARLRVAPLTGAQASERAVRARLPDAQVVHLATHGVAYSSDARAEDSFIALAPSTDAGGTFDTRADGHLTVRELLGDPALTLHADLVVLSACETALGRLRQSEGTLGLQRAFLARGARSVLVSLWRVDDTSTRMLMERFYVHWMDEGKSKADALRMAQNDLRQAGNVAPQLWAAFQLVGAA